MLPGNKVVGTETTAWIDMSKVFWIQAVIAIGAMAAGSTVDVKLEQAKDGAGTDAKDISGKSLAQLLQANADDNSAHIINCTSEQLDANEKYTHLRVSVTVGTDAADAGVLVFGHDGRYQPLQPISLVGQEVA